ncbi:DUF2332 domain-containing protein [Lysinibacillus sp. 3P01SB]|uniref:DUF2332 domain-containing protein n=1 Tax=Lysinibacillus sp. 3P01SB TaxID=3132284 RepID=UPI0039A55CC7
MDCYQQAFLQFAEQQAQESSRLYEYLCGEIINDEELMTIIRDIPLSQPKPNLFFAAIHYLVKKYEEPLGAYFASLTDYPLPAEQSFQPFRQFALKHQDELRELFRTKLVQTNEVSRAAYLYPIIADIHQSCGKPLALLEIGTSAGLLLGLDHYHYEYQNGPSICLTADTLTIFSENRGEPLPSSVFRHPIVQTRIGVDLHIVDLKETDHLEWMLALIWPEHKERRRQFLKAKEVNDSIQKDFYEGDAITLLPHIIQTVPMDCQVVVFHTHVANQFPAELKEQLIKILQEISYDRSLYHVYNNMYDANIHQDYIERGTTQPIRIMPAADGHGRWFVWKNGR